MKKLPLLAASALCSASALGAGFSLFQGDTTGIADTAGAIAKGGRAGDMYYNPASLGATTGTVVQAGTFITSPKLKVEGTDPYTGAHTTTSAKEKWFNIPHLYLAHQFNEDLSFGLGLFSRMGLGDEFPRSWPGRYNSTKVELATYDVMPALTWRVNDWLTIGGGITYQYFDIVLEQELDAAGIAGLRPYNATSPSPYDVHQRLHGDDDCALGWDLGVQIRPIEHLHFGLAYHSEVKVKAKGYARYDVPPAIRATYPGLFRDTPITGNITEPAYWMGAIAYDFTDRLTLGFNVTHSEWSSWDKLQINLENPILPGHDKLVSEKDWNDVWRYSIGGSYKLTDKWTLLGSFTYDDSPINRKHADYIVPADTREIYAIGCSYETGPWAIDGMYFFENINDCSFAGRPSEGILNGKYCDGYSHAVAMSVSYQF